VLFNSLEFLAFFPIVAGLFYSLPPRSRWVLLLAASYVFYGAWSPLYLGLLLFSSALDYFVAIRVAEAPNPRRKRAWLMASLVGNLGVLFSFKYYNLVNDTIAAAAGGLGFDWPMPRSSLVLPVGISFYTFQSLSYTVDVYRGELKPERKAGMFLLYVAYFPQLVAGPIERAGRLLPQLHRPAPFDWDRTVSGLRLVAWGMFKKVVVADRLAEVVNIVFADPRTFGGFGHAVAVFFFGYQVYCDFSGYSDIAVGVARILGVDLMRNFDQPYLARSMTELWSRWHISMSTWFRDYVYKPLGGNRVSTPRWALNVTIVFVGSGLWHGAQWSLIAWGAVHAFFVIAERLTQGPRTALQAWLGLPRVPWLEALVQWGCTFLCWQFSLVFFRSESFADALYVLLHIGTGWAPLVHGPSLLSFLTRVHLDGALFLFCLALCPLVELIDYGFRDGRIRAWVRGLPTVVQWGLDWALLAAIIVFGAFGETPFVYFQF
jgi:alginate O-acetyltransferase complex protein AlgI